MPGLRRLAELCCALVVAGCATLDPLQGVRSSPDPQARACVDWYASIDAAVAIAGVRDAQAVRIEGFPHLRADRFLAAMRDEARLDDAKLEALVERLAELDLTARGHEISNLPQEKLRSLAAPEGERSASQALRRTRECSRLLRDVLMQAPVARRMLLERLEVPDDYVTGYRVAGLYALTRLPFSAGVRRHMDETRAAFRRDLASEAPGTVLRYAPPKGPAVSALQVRSILALATRGPLSVPEPSGESLALLFAAYAPSFAVETTGRYDRPGRLRWGNGPTPDVDITEPVVYQQTAHTRYRGVNLLQLVYTAWFSGRPAQGPGDLLAGTLDGIVFRVTLAPDGSPLVYDTMHPCGCYHMFFTTPRATPLAAPEGEPEWAFVPQALPAISADDRLVLRIASRTHYLERVSIDSTDSPLRYAVRAYDELRSLPRGREGTRSLFGPDGTIAGTGRAEAWLFWPMGIANAGAMRQWGRHATAFVGRRHFDDADLMERRFVLELN